jgi:hypothetical protein
LLLEDGVPRLCSLDIGHLFSCFTCVKYRGLVSFKMPWRWTGQMLDVLMWIFWFVFGGYSFWFMTRAKRSQPLTLDELVILWKIHKQQARCSVPLSRVEPILDSRSNEFSGFKCECGYQYSSKRLILQRHALDRNMFIAMAPSKGERSSLLKT